MRSGLSGPHSGRRRRLHSIPKSSPRLPPDRATTDRHRYEVLVNAGRNAPPFRRDNGGIQGRSPVGTDFVTYCRTSPNRTPALAGIRTYGRCIAFRKNPPSRNFNQGKVGNMRPSPPTGGRDTPPAPDTQRRRRRVAAVAPNPAAPAPISSASTSMNDVPAAAPAALSVADFAVAIVSFFVSTN